MPVIAALALAGCGALFDSPDNPTVTPTTAVTVTCPDGSTAATLAECPPLPPMKTCPDGTTIPIADTCPPTVISNSDRASFETLKTTLATAMSDLDGAPDSPEKTTLLSDLAALNARLAALQTALDGDDASAFNNLFASFMTDAESFPTTLMTAMKVCNDGMIPLDDTCPPPVRQPACAANCPDHFAQSYLPGAPTITFTWSRSDSGRYEVQKNGGGQTGAEVVLNTASNNIITSHFAELGGGAPLGLYDITDEREYLIFGLWGSNSSNDRGGYVIGAKLPDDYELPSAGTAAYGGRGFTGIGAEGNLILTGDVSFTAAFGAQTRLSGSFTQRRPADPLTNEARFQILFDETVYDSATGRFSNGALSCGNIGCSGDIGGSWQAAFFGNGDGGAPSKLGGTFRATAQNIRLTGTGSGGSSFTNVELNGAFGAELQ